MNKITVVKNEGSKDQEITNISTDSYAVAYFVGDRIKVIADFSLAALAPYLLKYLANKFTN